MTTKTEETEDKSTKTWVVDTGPGDIPIYISQDWDETKKVIERDGKQIAYVLLNLETSTSTTTGNSTTTKTESKPVLCKYISLPIGTVIAPVNSSLGALGKAKSVMNYHLPPIPWVLLDEVDAGFRAVENKLHTEAIIILTYDMEYFGCENESEGWGFIVPKQKNSGTKCDYEHSSIIDDLPDDPHEVLVVGSIHSHPNMSAYASHTDEGDQLGFDGLHITFGWQKHLNNNATQYHIELQIGTQKTVMKPENVFEARDDEEVDENAHKNFFDKISKFNQYDSYKHGGYEHHGGFSGGGYNSVGKSSIPQKIVSINSGKLTIPEGCPKPSEDVVIIVKLWSMTESNCPCCNVTLTEAALAAGRCSNHICRVFLLKPGETLETLINKRKKANLPYELIDRDEKPRNDIVIWTRTMQSGSVQNAVSMNYQRMGSDSKKV